MIGLLSKESRVSSEHILWLFGLDLPGWSF